MVVDCDTPVMATTLMDTYVHTYVRTYMGVHNVCTIYVRIEARLK